MAGLAGMLGLSMLQQAAQGLAGGTGAMGGQGLLPMVGGGILDRLLKKKGAKTAKPQAQTMLGGASTSAPKTMLGY